MPATSATVAALAAHHALFAASQRCDLIFFSTAFFNEDAGAETYNVEMNKYIMKMHNGSLPQHVPFDKNTLYGEFHTIRSTLKTKKFLQQSGKILFVNDNIYTIYVYTGMNKGLK